MDQRHAPRHRRQLALRVVSEALAGHRIEGQIAQRIMAGGCAPDAGQLVEAVGDPGGRATAVAGPGIEIIRASPAAGPAGGVVAIGLEIRLIE